MSPHRFVRWLLCLVFAAGLAAGATRAAAATYTVTADRDSMLKELGPSDNYATLTELLVKTNGSGGDRHRAIYGFTLPVIPAGEVITSVSLRLWVTQANSNVFNVHRVTDSWAENSVTWGNTGADFNATSEGSFTPSTSGAYVSIPVTSLVEGWYNATFNNHGVMILGNTNADAKFTSREWSTSTQRPQLVITTAPVATGACPAGNYIVTPDRDSYIKEGTPNENNATKTELEVKANASGTNRIGAIYGFTLPSIAANEVITSAVLCFWVRRADTDTAYVHRVTDSWTESTVTWANTGGDFDPVSVASFTPQPQDEYVSIPITTLVRGWANGSIANHGVIVMPSANTDVKLTSREWATLAQRPQLRITTVPAATLSVVKSNAISSDPLNGSTNPKAIPGAVITYTLNVSNSGDGSATSNSTFVTDAVPAGMTLFVGDYGAAGSGPVAFTNGSPSSGLTYSFTSLASTTDSLSFSNNGGTSYAYTPVPDASGYDANVTHFRVNPAGSFAGTPTADSPSFQLQLRMTIR